MVGAVCRGGGSGHGSVERECVCSEAARRVPLIGLAESAVDF
jgi:hypothetical protein